jgi:hypothetical protein
LRFTDEQQDSVWLRGLDLNQRPSGYEPDELPSCSTPRPNCPDMAEQLPSQVRLEVHE